MAENPENLAPEILAQNAEIEFSLAPESSHQLSDNLFDEGNESDAAATIATSLYTYQPGDPYQKIENKSDLKILILKQIYDSELSVKRRGEGLFVVYYEGEPIVEMRGIEFIQTENGVAPIENWMFA